jgi:hypothetical protein
LPAAVRPQLRRILNAYAKTDPEVGYTQGMNFIARMFLLYQSEETAFWSFYSLMHLSSYPHRLFFVDALPKALFLSRLFENVARRRFPAIFAAFQERGMDFTVFAPQWFMVAFLSVSFDEDMAAFLFDQYLAYGIAPLFSLGLTILAIHEGMLKEEGFESFLKILTNPGASNMMQNKHQLNVAWNQNWITSAEFDGLMKAAHADAAASAPP